MSCGALGSFPPKISATRDGRRRCIKHGIGPAPQRPSPACLRRQDGIGRPAPRHAPDGVARQERAGQIVGATRPQRLQRQDGRGERRRRRATTELLEEHDDFDCSEAEPARVLGYGDADPPLVDHCLPQRGVVPAAGVDHFSHRGRRRQPVEELTGGVAQRLLILRKIEIHSLCSYWPYSAPARLLPLRFIRLARSAASSFARSARSVAASCWRLHLMVLVSGRG